MKIWILRLSQLALAIFSLAAIFYVIDLYDFPFSIKVFFTSLWALTVSQFLKILVF